MNSEKYTLVDGGISIDAKLSADNDEVYKLFVDATAVSRADTLHEGEARAKQILQLLDESNIGNRYQTGRNDSDLSVQIGYKQRGYGVYGLHAEIARPTVPDDEATRVATQAMRRMAHDLGLYPDAQIPGMVYARVSHVQGITLETSGEGSCSLETDGGSYDQTSETIELYPHNLYAHQMQLVCISGLIALVKAR